MPNPSMAHESPHFVERKSDRQSDRSLGALDSVEPRQINTEHFLIEEQDGALCLVLRAGRDLPRDSQIRQEGLHIARAKRRRMELVVEIDKPLNPVDIGFLRADAVMLEANAIAYARE